MKISDKGFSLIETICVLVILGLVGSYFFNGYINITKSHINADTNYHQMQKNQSALLRIILEMQSATVSPFTNNIITYTPTGESSSRTIAKTGTNLILHKDSDETDHILTNNVSSFTATYTNSVLHITLSTTFSDGVIDTFSTSIYPSN